MSIGLSGSVKVKYRKPRLPEYAFKTYLWNGKHPPCLFYGNLESASYFEFLFRFVEILAATVAMVDLHPLTTEHFYITFRDEFQATAIVTA